MMHIYLAGRYSRLAELNTYAQQLRDIGHVVNARWLQGLHQYGSDGERAEADLRTHFDMAQRFAREDVIDLAASECVISFTEKPREPSNNRGGRHVEFGLAYATGKRLMVVGWRENAFHYLDAVEFFSNWDDCLGTLIHEQWQADPISLDPR